MNKGNKLLNCNKIEINNWNFLNKHKSMGKENAQNESKEIIDVIRGRLWKFVKIVKKKFLIMISIAATAGQ